MRQVVLLGGWRRGESFLDSDMEENAKSKKKRENKRIRKKLINIERFGDVTCIAIKNKMKYIMVSTQKERVLIKCK